jgi:hypothetical protein
MCAQSKVSLSWCFLASFLSDFTGCSHLKDFGSSIDVHICYFVVVHSALNSVSCMFLILYPDLVCFAAMVGPHVLRVPLAVSAWAALLKSACPAAPIKSAHLWLQMALIVHAWPDLEDHHANGARPTHIPLEALKIHVKFALATAKAHLALLTQQTAVRLCS